MYEKAGKLYDAFSVNVKILGETGSMAGTDDAGTAWAASYDTRVGEVLGAVNDLTAAMQNYGGVIIQAGYNHAVAEHDATPGQQGPAPVKPAESPSVAGCLAAPPSAGGSGKGLLDDAIGLVEQLGVPVPDGDTDKIAKAADAWDRLATVYQTKSIVEALDVDARAFADTRSPEVGQIVDDLHTLREAASSVLGGCAELAKSCRGAVEVAAPEELGAKGKARGKAIAPSTAAPWGASRLGSPTGRQRSGYRLPGAWCGRQQQLGAHHGIRCRSSLPEWLCEVHKRAQSAREPRRKTWDAGRVAYPT